MLAGAVTRPPCLNWTQRCPKSARTTVVWADGCLTLPLPKVLCSLLLLITCLVALTVWSKAVLAQGPGGRAYPLVRLGIRGLSLFPANAGSTCLLLAGPPIGLAAPCLRVHILSYFGLRTRPLAVPKGTRVALFKNAAAVNP